MAKFYITTAIDYVNSEAHVGHSYQKVIADILTRWHKLNGQDTFFLTGTDEHGLKIERSARERNMDTKKFTDLMSSKFKKSWANLYINFDKFIRTTDNEHEKVVHAIIKKINDNGDIYKGFYEGLYCVECEAYYTEKEAEANKGFCPVHKTKSLEKIKEETYFFKLSKYQKFLLDHYKKNKSFILPEYRRNEIINRVSSGLKDLSITRSTFKWGIPYPYDKNHVCYVWFEALMSYISGLGYPEKNFNKFWPADVHLLGVDNGWFHAVIWPAMLKSAGIKLPKTVFIHGFLTANGQKISKSLGNVISPNYLVDKYGADAVRYFLAREVPLGQDGDFSEEALKARINGELANDLGNLVSRILSIAEKKTGGHVKKAKTDDKLSKKLELNKIEGLIDSFELHNALAEIFKFVNECNKHVNDERPWELEGKELEEHLYTLLEAIRIISILVSSFIPETSSKINKQLGIKEGRLKDCKFGVIKEYKVKKGEILFKKV